MKYVIQDTQDKRRGHHIGYYVYNPKLVTRYLYNAKQFKSFAAAQKFILKVIWFSEYKIIEVTNKELFKARLASK